MLPVVIATLREYIDSVTGLVVAVTGMLAGLVAFKRAWAPPRRKRNRRNGQESESAQTRNKPKLVFIGAAVTLVLVSSLILILHFQGKDSDPGTAKPPGFWDKPLAP
jgi:hypothetical protein